jgi:glycosyltransferase involved in cell wall biosynthesis
MNLSRRVAVVIPAYKVSKHINAVIKEIPDFVHKIIVVDDACPEASGQVVSNTFSDPRIVVLNHDKNQGVGGAMITGYKEALKNDSEIIVKLDGDGQMDPKLIPLLIAPIVRGEADYVKGNRFFDIQKIREMPAIRILGNLVLSFFSKASTGYWQIFDPNNGFTAIHTSALKLVPLEKISKRYFFESDMLFRLNTARAVVMDMPMDASYGTEKSNLSITKTIFEFPMKHMRNFLKRIIFSYYLRDFTLASLELPIGVVLTLTSAVAAIYNWIHSANLNQPTPTGTLVLIMMAMLTGIQLILSFAAYDIQAIPKNPISKLKEIGA